MTAVMVLHGGMGVSPSAGESVNAPSSSKSCKNNKVLRPIFPQKLPDVALDHAATIIAAAFPGPSENAICERASQALGVSGNTIRSILRKETKAPSWPLLFAALHYIEDPFSLPGMQAFIAGVLAK